jgi:heterodisulfide reductase subunit A
LGPKALDAGRHPLIELLTNAEVIGCEGEAGAFRVRVRKHPRFVRPDRCTACGLCVDACPQVQGNEFDLALKARKAIYRPFPQSVPSTYIIDRDACLNGKILACNRCVEACDPDAIDFDMLPEEVELDVGSILVAVGFQEFDPRKLPQYGYGRFPNVITSLELERMLNPAGVTAGHVVRPSDLATPKRIVFVQCVGARGEGGRPYCSRFCCMNAVKDSMLLREHDRDVGEITILYTDLRAFGKGFDDFVRRSQQENSARYLRGRPAKIERLPGTETLVVYVEDTVEGRQDRLEADLVVLSVAAAPNDHAVELAETLGIETNEYGFLTPSDPAVSAVETTRDGIFVCGSAVGPQVIPEAVAQASAAAARAELFLAGHRVRTTASPVALLEVSGPARIGVFICHCGINIAGLLHVEELAQYAATLPDVVVAETDLFACSSSGQDRLVRLIGENKLNRIVVAACTPRTHEPIFRETCSSVGLNPYLLEMVNIRDQCSWVHAGEPPAAQEKARTLIRMGIARARHLDPLAEREVPMEPSALVIGGGIAGIQAATDLAFQGFPVTLVEKSGRLGGRLAHPHLKSLYPDQRPARDVLERKLARLRASGARVLLETQVSDISGFLGNFNVSFQNGGVRSLRVGTIILATGAGLYDPRGEYGYGEFSNVITSEDLEQAFCESDALLVVKGCRPQSAAFILCVGSRDPNAFSGCSRYCCPTAIKQAILLSEQGIDTTIFYRDIRTVSAGAEEMYRRARGMGVLFVRIPPGGRPAVSGEGRAQAVTCYDELLHRRVEVPVDLVVLSVGMRPERSENEKIRAMLKTSLGSDGFFLERHPELGPVETSVEGVFLAGTLQGPKDIVDTVAQASAAAAKAAVFLCQEKAKQHPAIACIEPEHCTKCGICARVCPYHAINWRKGEVAELVEAMCAGCGTCAASCKFEAITMRHYTDQQLMAQVRAMLSDRPEDKVCVFACNWCSYAGADMAGISKLQYPASAHLIRTMCSGRVSEELVLEAFRQGAPVVLVSGCHYADCHYINANRQTVQRVQKLWTRLERAGVRPERLQLEWISAAEGQKFAHVMGRLEELRRSVTMEEIAHARDALWPKPETTKRGAERGEKSPAALHDRRDRRLG